MADDRGMRIRASLEHLRRGATAVFEVSHAANNDAGQRDANRRELVTQLSAAVTALDRARAAAARAFQPEPDEPAGCPVCTQLRNAFGGAKSPAPRSPALAATR